MCSAVQSPLRKDSSGASKLTYDSCDSFRPAYARTAPSESSVTALPPATRPAARRQPARSSATMPTSAQNAANIATYRPYTWLLTRPSLGVPAAVASAMPTVIASAEPSTIRVGSDHSRLYRAHTAAASPNAASPYVLVHRCQT